MTMLSTPPYSWLLLLEAAPSLHNTALSFPILCVEVLLLLFSSHSLLDIPTSYVPSLHTWSIVVSPPWLPAFLPPLLHTVWHDSLILQIYSLPLSSSSILLLFYSSGWGAQTSHIICTSSLLFLLILPLVWWGHAFGWAYCSWVRCIGPETLCYVLDRVWVCVKKGIYCLRMHCLLQRAHSCKGLSCGWVTLTSIPLFIGVWQRELVRVLAKLCMLLIHVRLFVLVYWSDYIT